MSPKAQEAPLNDARYSGTWHPYWAGWSYYIGDRIAGELLADRGGLWVPRLARWLGPDYPTFTQLTLDQADQQHISKHPKDTMITMALAVARAADAAAAAQRAEL